jgi:hypothetical protein
MSSFYTQPGVMTSLGRHSARAGDLPGDAAGVARIVQGLMIHEFWLDGYGVTMTGEERDTVNLRRVEQLLDAILARDDRPLDVAREPAARIATNCRGFTVMAVAVLRARGCRRGHDAASARTSPKGCSRTTGWRSISTTAGGSWSTPRSTGSRPTG